MNTESSSYQQISRSNIGLVHTEPSRLGQPFVDYSEGTAIVHSKGTAVFCIAKVGRRFPDLVIPDPVIRSPNRQSILLSSIGHPLPFVAIRVSTRVAIIQSG